jgi:hypothetical protein
MHCSTAVSALRESPSYSSLTYSSRIQTPQNCSELTCQIDPATIHRPTQSSLLSILESLRVSYHFRVSDTPHQPMVFFDLVVFHQEGALLNRCGLQTSSSLEAHRGIQGLLDTAHVHSWKHCALEAQCNIFLLQIDNHFLFSC